MERAWFHENQAFSLPFNLASAAPL